MSKPEMVPAKKRISKQPFKGLCGPEWQLLCWIRREIKVIQKLQATKSALVILNDAIIQTMNETFSNWPEDPK